MLNFVSPESRDRHYEVVARPERLRRTAAPGSPESESRNTRRGGIKRTLVVDLLAGMWRWEHKLAKLNAFCLFFLAKLSRRRSLLKRASQHPVYAYLLLTTRCSMNCEDCCFADVINNPSILKTDFAAEEVERIAKMDFFKGIGRVILFGGEPLMCRSHVDIIRLLRKRGLVVQLTSNGLHLSQNTLQRLADADLNMLNITIYDKTEAGKLRNIEKLRRAFEYIRAGAFPLKRVGLCYHSTDAADYKFAYDLAVELGAHHLLFNTTYLSTANAAFAEKVAVKPGFVEEYAALCGTIKEEGRINLYRPEPDESRPQACPFIETGITLGPTSAVSPCCLIAPNPRFGTVDDLSRLIRMKNGFLEGRIPGFCSGCPVMGTKYV